MNNGRQIMQMCNRCGGMLEATTPRDVIDGGVYHVYCGWKLRQQRAEQEAIRNINPDKGERHANTLPKGNGSGSVLHNERNPDSPPDSQSSVQEQPRALHWSSNQ